MKLCPQCNETYADDSLKFCLQDGKPLEHRESLFDAQADTLKFPDSSIPVQRRRKEKNILLWVIPIVIVGIISFALWQKLKSDSDKDTSPTSEIAANKVADIGLVSNDANPAIDTETYLLIRNRLPDDSTYLKTRIQFLSLALYSNNKAYIKVSICNADTTAGSLNVLYLWYTPPNGQDSINWRLFTAKENVLKKIMPIVELKPNECKTIGGWSEELSNSFQLTRPLGDIYISDSYDYPRDSINLRAADLRGLIKF